MAVDVMRDDLTTALARLDDLSTDKTAIQLNAYGLNNTSSTSLNATYQDLCSNRISTIPPADGATPTTPSTRY